MAVLNQISLSRRAYFATFLLLLSMQMVYASDDKETILSVKEIHGRYELDGELTIVVNNLSAWADKNGFAAASTITLYLDGRPMPDIKPILDRINRDEIRYNLVRTKKNAEQWDTLLGRPDLSLRKTMLVTVAAEGQSPSIL